MKLSNIFKKVAVSTSSVAKSNNIQQLDKNQLAKVIGGTDDSATSNTEVAANTKPRYIVKSDGIIYDVV